MAFYMVNAGLLHFCHKNSQRWKESSEIYGGSPRCQKLQEKIERRGSCHTKGRRKRDQEGLEKETAWQQVHK